MNKLELCPFCGAAADYHECGVLESGENETYKITATNKYGVHCTGCHAATEMCDTKEAAAALWNRRTKGDDYIRKYINEVEKTIRSKCAQFNYKYKVNPRNVVVPYGTTTILEKEKNEFYTPIKDSNTVAKIFGLIILESPKIMDVSMIEVF